ncbi:tRNA pseudouridine(55) synthase TruB [Terriglobus roseus]|uniref:tRNA pseudouridine synthase B n=1 Tax=Terriglobus roseus TaxID=392734 RepID=A0A1H4JCT3_9BACT|nr:tRNA pseudouridine(55) synthase TruB [Terriglobus roseus]SEB43796.1 tRNA pseudouridine synthase B [Terriglobus roseus]
MNGLLIFDKPPGLTSHDVVSLVRRATGEKSVGHLGTLDPMATGVLPLLLGKWTRLAQFFNAAEKHYTGTIRFGFATDTYDAEGEPAGEAQPLTCTLDQLRELGKRFHGELDQVPPVFSAKKIGGVPAHKLARQGKEVTVKPARITIHGFELTGLVGDTASFTMHVSAGGYVRSVAHELGQLAGCGAHLSALRRVQAGPFTLAEAITREQLIAAVNAGNVETLLPHARTVLPGMPAVTADEGSQNKLRNGMAVNLPEFSDAPLVRIFKDRNELLGIGRRVAGTLIQPFVNLA